MPVAVARSAKRMEEQDDDNEEEEEDESVVGLEMMVVNGSDLLNLRPTIVASDGKEAGIPLGAQTTADVPSSLGTFLMDSMDCTQPQIEAILRHLKLDVVFFDFTHRLPALALWLGIESVFYSVVNPSMIAYALSPVRRFPGEELAEVNIAQPLERYPLSAMKLHGREARAFEARRKKKFGEDMLFYARLYASLYKCDALGFSTCGEIERPFCDYLRSQ
ncbi:cyanidin 3-O-galactoside 2''-O-xylosyltransferase FGGT1-like [Diospyros lotus]|uniref:cyanidin 3-O-galactoside 2''-O-xylosyltransferase FGGT1-like n=1 Tax=Diospyros lotus TaxID=55363 RepID=UPI00225B5CC3|nr:cyanidin 3-O-galactoside 2''-O-xylosyltransferase FGGT1-like [Diospyros lotus]